MLTLLKKVSSLHKIEVNGLNDSFAASDEQLLVVSNQVGRELFDRGLYEPCLLLLETLVDTIQLVNDKYLGDFAFALLLLGRCHLAINDYAAAESVLARCIRVEQRLPVVAYNAESPGLAQMSLASVLSRLQRIDDALVYAREAVQILLESNSRSPSEDSIQQLCVGYTLLSRLFEKQGQMNLSVASLRAAAQLAKAAHEIASAALLISSATQAKPLTTVDGEKTKGIQSAITVLPIFQQCIDAYQQATKRYGEPDPVLLSKFMSQPRLELSPRVGDIPYADTPSSAVLSHSLASTSPSAVSVSPVPSTLSAVEDEEVRMKLLELSDVDERAFPRRPVGVARPFQSVSLNSGSHYPQPARPTSAKSTGRKGVPLIPIHDQLPHTTGAASRRSALSGRSNVSVKAAFPGRPAPVVVRKTSEPKPEWNDSVARTPSPRAKTPTRPRSVSRSRSPHRATDENVPASSMLSEAIRQTFEHAASHAPPPLRKSISEGTREQKTAAGELKQMWDAEQMSDSQVQDVLERLRNVPDNLQTLLEAIVPEPLSAPSASAVQPKRVGRTDTRTDTRKDETVTSTEPVQNSHAEVRPITVSSRSRSPIQRSVSPVNSKYRPLAPSMSVGMRSLSPIPADARSNNLRPSSPAQLRRLNRMTERLLDSIDSTPPPEEMKELRLTEDDDGMFIAPRPVKKVTSQSQYRFHSS